MTSATLNQWFYVSLTFKKISDSSTVTHRFITREPTETTANEYWPILQGVTGLANVNGEYIPRNISGTLELDNSPNSFLDGRRLSDYLQEYTLENQSGALYSANTDLGDLDPDSDFTLRWTADVDKWREDEEKIVITLKSTGINRDTLNTVIRADDFPNSPDASLGLYLPIVFGTNREVKPILIDPSAETWAYASTFGTDYDVGGVQVYYAKDLDGFYQPVITASSTSTPAINPTAPDSGTQVIYDVIGTKEMVGSICIDGGTGENYIFSSGRVRARGNGAGGTQSESYVNIFLCEVESGASPPSKIKTVATAVIDKRDYENQIDASISTWFWMDFSFNKPVIPKDGKDYYIIFDDDNDTGTGQIILGIYSGDGGEIVYSQENNADQSAWFVTDASNRLVVQLYGVKMTDSTSSAASYASFTVTQATAGTGQTAPELSDLNFVVEVDGFEDDGSGTITGSANSQLEEVHHVIELLLMSWNNGSWDSSLLDTTKFSAEHTKHLSTSTDTYYRKVGGVALGRVERERLIQEICMNSACRLIRHNGASNQLALYPWGAHNDIAQIDSADVMIKHEQAEVLSVTGAGEKSIVNRATVLYDKRIQSSDVTTITAQGSFRQYAGVTKRDKDYNGFYEYVIGESENLYGLRENRGFSFNFIQDASSAEFMARYLLANFGKPSMHPEIEVPYFEYADLENMDVIYIKHPALPAKGGTSAQVKNPQLDGEEVDLFKGNHTPLAQTYRAQIEGLGPISFNSERGDAPRMRIQLRLLTNSLHDPT